MTAFNEQHNFLLQWEAPFYASRLYGTKALFAYEFNIPMLQEKRPGKFNWGTGIYYNNMGYGDRFKRIQFGITHSFSANLKKGGQLRLGFEFFNFYIHPLTEAQVDGQIAPNQGAARVKSGKLDGGVLGYGMINFGVWYQKRNFFVGAAANNINTLEGWHFKGNEKERAMPMELYVHGGYHFALGPVVITPMIEYYGKNFNTAQVFRPRINVQSLRGKLLTGVGYGSKTVTANVGYRVKFMTFNAEAGVSTMSYGPLKGGWVASAAVIFHFKGKKNKLVASPNDVILLESQP